MNFTSTSITYQKTNSFKDLVIAFVNENEHLKEFYKYPTQLNSIEKVIADKQNNFKNRALIHKHFVLEYNSNNASNQQLKNIEALQFDNCFTITTAHQPNIFTGPLYFIYKIIHAIIIANELNQKYEEYKFVPVYYMGSEDADLDEIGTTTIQQKKLVWTTKQTGAVGRMKVDENFIKLIFEIEGQIGVLPFGNELINIFKDCYKLNESIQNCTFKLVNTLFKDYGLLVLNPDNATLKKSFNEVVIKELTEQFSEKEVNKTVAAIQQHFKITHTGRNINLFYLIDDKRERIELINNEYFIEKLNLKFSIEQIIDEVKLHPERFSANVILRPVFQETILPNLVFVGGGGEISYWLQLKNVFEKANVNYPMMVLRNSFLLFTKKQSQKIQKLQLKVENLFANQEQIFTKYIKENFTKAVDISEDIEYIKNCYIGLRLFSRSIDNTLSNHIDALQTKALQKLDTLQQKLIKAEKRKHSEAKNQIEKLKSELFPNNSLQERNESFIIFYATYGNAFFDTILKNSKAFEQEFSMIEME